jgi:hypothetical protein
MNYGNLRFFLLKIGSLITSYIGNPQLFNKEAITLIGIIMEKEISQLIFFIISILISNLLLYK